MFWRRLVLFGSLFLAGACATVRPQPTPKFAPDFEAGVNLHSNPKLELVHAMGARWVRLNLDWERMQPQRDMWDFTHADASIAAAEAAGLKVYACLLYSPPWASSNGKGNGIPEQAAWETYVTAVARRYGTRVAAFGIWNEPNLDDYWVGNARDYVQRLLIPASAIIHREAPGVIVAGPDLAQLLTGTIAVTKFFRELKLYGGYQALDVISHHVYGRDDFEGKLVGPKFLGVPYRLGLRQVLWMQGMAGKELWLTETGVDAREIGPQRQAELLAAQWRLLARLPWVKKAFVYNWADDAGQAAQWGLLRPDRQPTAAYDALKELLAPDVHSQPQVLGAK